MSIRICCTEHENSSSALSHRYSCLLQERKEKQRRYHEVKSNPSVSDIMLFLSLHTAALWRTMLQHCGKQIFWFWMRICVLMVQDPSTCRGTGRMPGNYACMVRSEASWVQFSGPDIGILCHLRCLAVSTLATGSKQGWMRPARDLCPPGMSAGSRTGYPGLSKLVLDDCA